MAGLHKSCCACHPQAFADWQASRHSATYARIFLDPAHNAKEPPANDCFRCHGMFFQQPDGLTRIAREVPHHAADVGLERMDIEGERAAVAVAAVQRAMG